MAFSLNPASILGPEFYGFLLPWIFTFAIVYGLLLKAEVFKNKNINTALAFVIAFFVTGAAGPQMAAFFINLFGGASVYLAGILVLILFVVMLGKPGNYFSSHIIYIIIAAVIGIVLFLSSTGMFIGNVVIGSDIAVLAFWLAIIVIAIYMIVGKDGGGAPASGKKE